MSSTTATENTISSGQRVLVTGATGYTGSTLVQKLLNQNVEVVAIARPSSDLSRWQDAPIRWIQGNVFDPKLIQEAMEGVNYIFHMVTPFREAKSSDDVYYNVHVKSTQLLANEALKQPDFKRFVHISTIGVHGHIENPPADETYRTSPGDLYQSTKLEGEIWIKQFGAETGLPITIIRPAGIIGPGEKRLLKIYKMVCSGLVPAIGNGGNLLHLIHVDDLTNCFLLASQHPNAVNEVFICGNQDSISFKEMVNLISKYYQKKATLLQLPAAPLFLLGDILEFVCKPLNIEPPIYRRRLAFYTKDRSFNVNKLKSKLGFVPQHSNEQCITELAQWYLQEGWTTVN